MTIQAVRLVRTSKVFYRNGFRKVIMLLFFSLVINTLLGFGIYNKMINQKIPDFYSTNGLTAPAALNMLLDPNYSSKALLKPDPDHDDDDEVMMSHG